MCMQCLFYAQLGNTFSCALRLSRLPIPITVWDYSLSHNATPCRLSYGTGSNPPGFQG